MEAIPPLVSVVVATYRCDDYLRLALASILAQTHANFEVLVSDDGGEDATRAVVESFRDPRLIYRPNPIRLGPAGNHWAAFRRARGEFVAILNHDDLWKPAFLRQVLAGFRDERVVVSFCDHDVIDPDGHLLVETTEELSRGSGRASLAPGVHFPFAHLAAVGTVPAAQAAIFKKSALDLPRLPPEAGPAYDLWLNYLLARGGGAACYVPERLASWRTHPASISMTSTRSDWPAGGGDCLAAMAADPLFAAQRSFLTRRAAGNYTAAALSALRGGRAAEARRYAHLALRQAPTRPGTLAAFALILAPRFLQQLVLRK